MGVEPYVVWGRGACAYLVFVAQTNTARCFAKILVRLFGLVVQYILNVLRGERGLGLLDLIWVSDGLAVPYIVTGLFGVVGVVYAKQLGADVPIDFGERSAVNLVFTQDGKL